MSEKEAARVVDLTGFSLILPHQATWHQKSVGRTNPRRQLSIQELRALLGLAREAL